MYHKMQREKFYKLSTATYKKSTKFGAIKLSRCEEDNVFVTDQIQFYYFIVYYLIYFIKRRTKYTTRCVL